MNAMTEGLARVIVAADASGDVVNWNYALMCAKRERADGIDVVNAARVSGDMGAYLAARGVMVEDARKVLSRA